MRVSAGISWFSFVFVMLTLNGCESKPSVSRDKVQEAWDNYNNPAQLDAGSVVVFNDLPQSGESLKIPWADIYWPSHLGGVALRWKSGFQSPFQLPRLSESQVRSMSAAQLAELSPAEKYDIYMGRFDFPTVQAELMRTHPAMPSWFGLCHGWSSAALNFDEPNAVTVRGPSGLEVPFGSSDVKALLAYAQGVVFMPVARAVGQRCEVDFSTRPELRNSAACRDTNAGSFHLILANLIGRQGQSLIADLSNGSEVWNFPIYGFSTREISRQPRSSEAAPQAVSEVVVETDVDFLVESEQPSWLSFGDSRPVAGQRNRYQYVVELDGLGRVVGGRWLSDERPDFVWLQERADFRGYYAGIETIYSNSISSAGVGNQPVVISTPTATPTPWVTPTPVPTPTHVATPIAPPVPDAPVAPPPPPVAQPSPPPPPSSEPDQPMAPVLTQPVPLPLPPSAPTAAPAFTPKPPAPLEPSSVSTVGTYCPSGTYVTVSPLTFCTDGVRAIAPYTRAMTDACLKSSAAGCFDSFWTVELYLSLRGREYCPLGSTWDPQISACVEDTMVLGPFTREFTDRCVAAGFGNMCFAMKINSIYFSLVNLPR